MMRFLVGLVAFGVMAASVACGGSGDNKSSSSSSAAAAATSAPVLAATTTTTAGTPSVQAASSATPSASPGANPAARTTGTVQSVANGIVTLSDGTKFMLAANARVIKTQAIKASDLQKGQFVAITAKRQPDNTLLASIVNIFPPSLNSASFSGQRPLPEGNLMTNATIDTISGSSFTVVFEGGGAKISLAPDATLTKQIDATPADLTPGTKISAGVNNGVAMNVAID